MKNSAIVKAKINWLTEQNSAPLFYQPDKDITHFDIPMSGEMGSGYVDILNLNLQMDISRGIHHFSPQMTGQLLPFAEVEGELNEPLFTVHSALTGRVVLRELHVGCELIYGHGLELFQYVDHLHFIPQLDASEDIQVTMLKIGKTTLDHLLGEEFSLPLLSCLGINKLPSARVSRIPAHITAILHSSMADHLTGSMRKVYAQGKVMDYLCALTCHITEEKVESFSHKKQQIKQLHEELMQLQGKIPTLDELAGRYKMSVKSLNDNFKLVFGKTINRFISEHRLNQAHIALRETDIAMKSLSAQIGYSHVNHFINAFKKQFGYPPGSLRKK